MIELLLASELFLSNELKIELLFASELFLSNELRIELFLVSDLSIELFFANELFLSNELRIELLLVSDWNEIKRDDMIEIKSIFLIFEFSYTLKLLEWQEFFFFSSNIINLDERWTTMSETKERKHDESVKFEVDFNDVTTQLKKTHNDKILI